MSTSDRRTWAPRLSALNVMCARAVSVFECPRTAMHLPCESGLGPRGGRGRVARAGCLTIAIRGAGVPGHDSFNFTVM